MSGYVLIMSGYCILMQIHGHVLLQYQDINLKFQDILSSFMSQHGLHLDEMCSDTLLKVRLIVKSIL